MNPKWHNINPCEGIMIAIMEDGEKEVLNWIESMNDPYKRIRYRSVYFDVLKRLEK